MMATTIMSSTSVKPLRFRPLAKLVASIAVFRFF
jgi:hypothetical protein